MTATSTMNLQSQFSTQGYAIAPSLFTTGEINNIRDTFMHVAKDGPIEGLSEFQHAGVPKYSESDPLRKYPRMMHPHTHPDLPVGPLATKHMLDARLHQILKQLMNDEPIAVQSMFYFKPPGSRGQDLHQDNYYLRVKPGTCVAAWTAIDDADESNGGMVVVPGSSNLEIACPEKADPQKFFTTDHVPIPAGLREVPVNLKAGDCLFFNGSLIHGSHPNTSNRFRRSLICHYVPASTKELANWYRHPTRFDGTKVTIGEAQGGGPCGTVGPTAIH